MNNNCFFRTIPENNPKALLQITERCNLHCVHCFLNADNKGSDMSINKIEENIIPFLKKLKVKKITLTGGEPFAHKDIIQICKLLVRNGFIITICTNATLITNDQIKQLSSLHNIKFNVSLDGFSKFSVEQFRGCKDIFENIIHTIKILSSLKLLKGLLVTPNKFANYSEYVDLCSFAKKLNINYVLINPLSEFGRGVDSKNKFATSNLTNKKIIENTIAFNDKNFEMTYIRLNNQNNPLGKCHANKLFYIFSNGDVCNCPYLIFATKTPKSKYTPKDFLLGNVFNNSFLNTSSDSLNSFFTQNISRNNNCLSCNYNKKCGFGCPAMIIADGQYLNGIDKDVCCFHNYV